MDKEVDRPESPRDGQALGSQILRNIWIPPVPVSTSKNEQVNKGLGFPNPQGQAGRGNLAFGLSKKAHANVSSSQLRPSLPITQMFDQKRHDGRLSGFFHLRGQMGKSHEAFGRADPQLMPSGGFSSAMDLSSNPMMLTGIRIGSTFLSQAK
jgi:hypothetical protein